MNELESIVSFLISFLSLSSSSYEFFFSFGNENSSKASNNSVLEINYCIRI